MEAASKEECAYSQPIAQSGGHYRGVANADDSFTERDFAKLHEAGFRGVRFNFVKHLGGIPDMGEFHRVVARIKPLGWHVDLHFDALDIPSSTDFINSLPVPFIIDHMGRVPTKNGQPCWLITPTTNLRKRTSQS